MSSSEEASFFYQFLLLEMLAESYEQINEGFRYVLKEYAKAVKAHEPEALYQIERMHGEVAKEAQKRIIDAYLRSPYIRHSKRPYRHNEARLKLKRYANKAMLNALKDPNLITSDSRGIYFLDYSILDRQAKQWYRLNFGTLPRGAVKVEEGSMNLMGKSTSISVNLRDRKPSKFFYTSSGNSYGFWSSQFAPTNSGEFTGVPWDRSRAGLDAFYIMSSENTVKNLAKSNSRKLVRRRRLSRGILGSSFLQAGTAYINEVYLNRLYGIAESWMTPGGAVDTEWTTEPILPSLPPVPPPKPRPRSAATQKRYDRFKEVHKTELRIYYAYYNWARREWLKGNYAAKEVFEQWRRKLPGGNKFRPLKWKY